MRPARVDIGWAQPLLLTACVASHPDDIQVAQQHLREFGFAPGLVNRVYRDQTRAAVLAYQTRYGMPVSGLLGWASRFELIPGVTLRAPRAKCSSSPGHQNRGVATAT
jgi:peptidoglycan hydrolase-like protein with peptidoglycan-binding domain